MKSSKVTFLQTLLLLLAFGMLHTPVQAEESEGPTPFEIGVAKGALARLSPDAGRLITALDAAAAAKDQAQMNLSVETLRTLGLPPEHINTLVAAAKFSKGYDKSLEDAGAVVGKAAIDLLNWAMEPDPISKGEHATIKSLKTDHNATQDGQIGMLIHLDCTVHRHLNKQCMVVAYFTFQNGEALKDFDGTYTTADGKVSASAQFTPGFENTRYQDITVFMPYSQLHLGAGKSFVDVEVGIYCSHGKHWLCPNVKTGLSYEQ